MAKRYIPSIFIVLLMVTTLVSPAFGAGHQGITDCFVCHDFVNGYYESPALGNLRWVNDAIAWPVGSTPSTVSFTAFSSTLPADGTMADGNNLLLDGPCEVCHTETAYHTRTDDGTTHFDGEDCIVCHAHFPEEGDYFAPTLPGPESHETHLNAQKGPMISDCTGCHTDGDYSLFADGKPLAETTICDPCHSPDGIYDGVDDPVLGAKPNWETGVYVTDTHDLISGKENWCATCHDDGISKVDEIRAPNVMGDGVSYSYYTSGHGRGSINIGCASCHDFSGLHTDGDQRTYRANLDNYTTGYRLINDRQMDVPRSGDDVDEPFALCTTSGCHSLDTLYPYATTNFRDLYPINFGLHEMHLGFFGYQDDIWDSDWNGKEDSAMSCAACHNVHGSPMQVNDTLVPNPVMIRHGELMSKAGTDTKVPAFDFRWFRPSGKETNVRALSEEGSLLCGNISYDDELPINNSCIGCHESGRVNYVRTPYEEANVSINSLHTEDANGVATTSFAPGEEIVCFAPLTVTGTAGSYYIDTAVEIINTDGNVNWALNFGSEQSLPAGTHDQSWTKFIPEEAIAGTNAVVVVTVKMYDAPQGALLKETTASLNLTIDEGTLPEQTITVEKVWVTDLSNEIKGTFTPEEDIRCYVRFTVEGTAANYYIDMKGKIYNKSGSTDWKANVGNGETISSGTYERYWDGTIPAEAEIGTDARLRFKLKLYDVPDGDLLTEGVKGKNFGIEEAAPPEDSVIVETVWTTDLSNNEKTSFLPGEEIRCYVTFTVDGLEPSRFCEIKGKVYNTGGDVDWQKTMNGEETLSDGTYQRYFDTKIPSDAVGGTAAQVKYNVKMYDTNGDLVANDIKTVDITVAEEAQPDYVVTVNEVWATDLSNNVKSNFQPGEEIRCYVNFSVDSIESTHFYEIKGKIYNTSGDVDWQKTVKGEESLSNGTYQRYYDTKISPNAVGGTNAQVKFNVRMFNTNGDLVANNVKTLDIAVDGVVQPDHLVTVDAVGTTDLSDVEKTTFAPGEDIRCNVQFTITGIATNYFVEVKGKIFNASGDVEWKTSKTLTDTLIPGTYDMSLDRSIPLEAVSGTDGKVRFNVYIYDSEGGTLLSEDVKRQDISIAE